MSFRFERGESVTAGVRRIAAEQLDAARRELHDPDLDREAAVHGVRKRCKKVRALLRLVRPAAPDVCRHENLALRDAARRLAELRDASTRCEALDELDGLLPAEADASGPPDGGLAALETLRDRLVAHRDRVFADREHVTDRLAACAEDLLGVAERLAAVELDAEGWDALEGGLGRSYRRGRRARPDLDGSTEAFHEWRKRVKDHWYHLRLLRGVWPRVMRAHVSAAHQLSDLLGREHDLALLSAALRPEVQGVRLPPPTESSAAVDERIATRRQTLRRKALRLGRKLYAEKPKALRRRLGAWWDA